MIIDYSKLFRTPDELADFCMLNAAEQGTLLLRYAQEGRAGLSMVCELKQREETGCKPSSRS